MNSLIGDRFLKQFFGRRMDRHTANPAGEAMALPANETDEPDESGIAMRGNLPDTDADLENEQTGEINQLTVPENGSDQPTTDDNPLTADVCRK